MTLTPVARQMQWPLVLDAEQRWMHICTQLIDMNVAHQRDRMAVPSVARYGDDVEEYPGGVRRAGCVPLE